MMIINFIVIVMMITTVIIPMFRSRADEAGAGERPNLENSSLC